jgi:hypothetical protein
MLESNGVLFQEPTLAQDWRKSDLIVQLQYNVAKRLALKGSMVNSDVLHIIYTLCAYETAIFQGKTLHHSM